MTARQLVLDLPAAEGMTRSDFLPAASNAAALEMIGATARWPGGAMLLIGPRGSGRSHLAHIWAVEQGAPLLTGAALDPGLVAAAAAVPALAIDDCQDVAGDADREEALFHLFNAARHGRRPLLLTARDVPGTWGLRLPDLASRMQGCAQTRLAAPDEALIQMVLVKLCHDRQLAVSAPALRYLALRLDRSLAAARQTVAALDRAALTRQRPVTRQTAVEVLAAQRPDGAADIAEVTR